MDSLTDLGLYVDERQEIRLVDPVVLQKTIQLKDFISMFMEKNDDFKKSVSSFIFSLEDVAKQVEQQKIKAIGSRSMIKALEMERDGVKDQYRNLIREKKIQLERMQLEHELLRREETEQQNLLQTLQRLK